MAIPLDCSLVDLLSVEVTVGLAKDIQEQLSLCRNRTVFYRQGMVAFDSHSHISIITRGSFPCQIELDIRNMAFSLELEKRDAVLWGVSVVDKQAGLT